MTEPLTTPRDVEAALVRPLTDLENTYIDDLIGQAASLLRLRAPSIDDRLARYAADSTDPTAVGPEAVATVLAGVVKRYLDNPKGLVADANSMGPYSHTESYALRTDKNRRGALEITDEDISVLFPTRKRLRAGTIRVRPALAQRPVGRYGPIPTPAQAISTAITFAPHISEAERTVSEELG